MIFIVQNCNNESPSPLSTIKNFLGSSTLLDSNSIELCIGGSFEIELEVVDTSGFDSLSFVSNFKNQFPTGTDSIYYPNTPISYDTAILVFKWNAINTNKSFIPFYVELSDNVCPIPGITYHTFDVTVVKSTTAGSDISICKGSEIANLNASGGELFVWKVMPGGDPMIVGPPGIGNFSCDTCKNLSKKINLLFSAK